MRSVLVLFLFLSLNGFSQGKFKLLTSIALEARFFTTDNLGNMYVVTKNELIKFNKSGKELYKYSTKKFGSISGVDASNMMKILVYFKDFSQVVFLDNTLSANGEPVSFDKMGMQQVRLVASSFNNGMWIYDQQNFDLLQLNTTNEIIHKTGNLSNLLNTELQPDHLFEKDNMVYLNNPSSGILMFDIYGTYFKTIPVKGASQFQVIGDQVYFMKDNKLRAYNIKTTDESEFSAPLNNFLGFRLEMETLYLQTAEGISIFAATE
ncbi:MAG: hypothetical protein K0Q95_2576 [Bacteroidota bacterium]|jgi:hypothetical protein|nr:hypothetical protein [Bacteroidota bacterium]